LKQREAAIPETRPHYIVYLDYIVVLYT
jgi:hypothetical protein